MTRNLQSGQEITVMLMNGTEVRGPIRSMGRDWIEIGNRRIYEGLIGGWEVEATFPLITSADENSASTNIAASKLVSPQPALTVNVVSELAKTEPVGIPPHGIEIASPTQPATALPSDTSLIDSNIAAQSKIELDMLQARLQASIQFAKLESPAFVREFNETKFAEYSVQKLKIIRQKWSQAINICDNAFRIKEFQRFRAALPIFESLQEEMQLEESLVINIAVLYLHLDQPKKALEKIEQAIEETPTLNLFSIAAYCAKECGAAGKAMWWLAHFCSKPQASKSLGEFYCLLRLIEEHKTIRVLEFLAELADDNNPDESTVLRIREAVAYFLFKYNHVSEAIALLDATKSMRRIAGFKQEICDLICQLPPYHSQIWEDVLRTVEIEANQRKEREIAMAWAKRREELKEKARLVANGIIVAYQPDRGYGFIADKAGKRAYFHRDTIRDPQLLKMLSKFKDGMRVPVSCQFATTADGTLRPRDVSLPHSSESLLNEAKANAFNGNQSLALGQLNLLLEIDPDNAEAAELLNQAKRFNSSLPKGDTPYARAKRAHIQNHDFDLAEKLYLEAIKADSPPQSAIHDLASLYMQTGRPREAAALVKNNLPKMANRLKALNLLFNCYQQADQNAEAISVLLDVKKIIAKSEATEIDKRIASVQYRMRKYDEAEATLNSVLRTSKNDDAAKRMLDALKIAKQTGRFESANEMFKMEMSQKMFGISPILNMALAKCKYEGLRKQDITERNFSEDTVAYLKGYINSLGAARPRERAACHLTSAKLLQDLNPETNTQFRSDLRQYCGLMGDALAIDRNVHMDVVRCFYAEAFAFADSHQLGKQLTVKASQYLLSYVCKREELLESHIPSLVQSVSRVFESFPLPKRIWDGILEIFLIDRSAAETLLPVLFDHPKARAESIEFLGSFNNNAHTKPANLKEYARLWEQARTSRFRDHEAISHALQTTKIESLSTVEIDMLQKTLRESRNPWFFDLDSKRIEALMQIADYLEQFNRQSAYEERERHLAMALVLAKRELDDIDTNPTRLSAGVFLPLLNRIADCIKEADEDLFRRATPKVHLSLAVNMSSASVGKDLTLHITVFNSLDSSPISFTELTLFEDPGLYYPTHTTHTVQESIRGGERRIVPCVIRITDRAIQERQITVSVSLSYLTRKNQRVELEAQQLSLRLYDEADFEEIPNPYAPFALGGPVKDPHMFIGRNDLIAQIRDVIGQPTTKCFALFGQKRAGKSSVLHHLNESLLAEKDRYICVTFSLGEIQLDFSVQKFLHRILVRLGSFLEEAREKGIPTPIFSYPSAADLIDPVTQFIDAIEDLLTRCRAFDEWHSRRIVVTIDEFTYLYTAIQKNEVSERFMKAWKAILEKGIMSVVVVGQDVMPKFKLKFENEFGSTQDKRLTYLNEHDARRLVEDPIRLKDGESRFKERAVERILDLTAGNPFYIQIICDRLVELLNHARSVYATEVEVNQVVEQLILGDSPLRYGNFENLVVAGDADLEAKAAESVLRILKQIAKSARGRICPSSEALRCEIPDCEQILHDLVLRDVLDMPQPGMYRIRVGLFHEWLNAQIVQSEGTVDA